VENFKKWFWLGFKKCAYAGEMSESEGLQFPVWPVFLF
jgi:hypothetical protein